MKLHKSLDYGCSNYNFIKLLKCSNILSFYNKIKSFDVTISRAIVMYLWLHVKSHCWYSYYAGLACTWQCWNM